MRHSARNRVVTLLLRLALLGLAVLVVVVAVPCPTRAIVIACLAVASWDLFSPID